MDELLKAIAEGDIARIEEIIGAGIDLNRAAEVQHPRYRGKTDMVPLAWAAFKGATLGAEITREIIERLIAGGADPAVGPTLLYATSEQAIDQLISNGADPNAKMTDGDSSEIGATPLMFRAEALDATSVRKLLTAGADAALVTQSDRSALYYGIVGKKRITVQQNINDRIDVINQIAASGLDFSFFTDAFLAIPEIEIAQYRRGERVSPIGRTRFSVRPIMERLVFYGGNPGDAFGSYRQNILMLMLKNKGFRFEPYDEFAWLCRNYGFTLLDASDPRGKSPLHHLIWPPIGFEFPIPDTHQLARLFLSYFADANYQDNTGASPLHDIVRKACRAPETVSPYPFPCDWPPTDQCTECTEVARALVDAGGDVDLRDYRGKTPAQDARDRPRCPLTDVVRSQGPSGLPETRPNAYPDADQSPPEDECEDERSEAHDTFGAPEGGGGHMDEIAIELFDHPLLYGTSEELCTKLVNADDYDVPDDIEFDRVQATTEDPEVSRLSAPAQASYREANAAYLANAGHRDPYIRINPGNGRRSTIRQAELYEAYVWFRYYGGPGPQPRANRPGKSKHEFGYAIDVVRSNDEARLSGALSGADWEQTVDDELWHWEAAGADRYDDLVRFIDTTMDTLSERWALTLSGFYEVRALAMALREQLNNEVAELQQAERRAGATRRELDADYSELQTIERDLRNEYNDIRRLDERIRQMQRERASKRYTYCPNGNSYNDCLHSDRKRRYDREIAQLEQSIEQGRAQRQRRARAYEIGRRQLRDKRRLYAQKRTRWREERRLVSEAAQKAARTRQNHQARQRQMQQYRQRAAGQLTEIVNQIGAW